MARQRSDRVVWCRRCHNKYSQSSKGLCRSCERELGLVSTTVEREAETLARQQARFAAAERAAAVPAQIYTLTIGGVDYEVVNDPLGFGRARAERWNDDEETEP